MKKTFFQNTTLILKPIFFTLFVLALIITVFNPHLVLNSENLKVALLCLIGFNTIAIFIFLFITKPWRLYAAKQYAGAYILLFFALFLGYFGIFRNVSAYFQEPQIILYTTGTCNVSYTNSKKAWGQQYYLLSIKKRILRIKGSS